eukprot:CAMPEP_0181533486 /NCGR_PEP_ID=MMETSP1110-20121109/73175_1 /TAXON_ID=174948 /ORGANISM="Symbiodinium sp., Strain CCMP421" /LENGTH=71 /DNA_ID=CAMNT_0023664657 /DNA_START=93 /DNA_END=306 /DNA_ORIENTATION=+
MIRQESLRICDLIATVETGPHQRPQSVEVVPVTCDFDATGGLELIDTFEPWMYFLRSLPSEVRQLQDEMDR